MWIGGADADADRRQAFGRHSTTRLCCHPSWRYVDCFGVRRVEVESILDSWPDLRGDACRRSHVDPCFIRETKVQPAAIFLAAAYQGFGMELLGIVDVNRCRQAMDRPVKGLKISVGQPGGLRKNRVRMTLLNMVFGSVSSGVSAVCGTCSPNGCAVGTHCLGDRKGSAEGDPDLLWGQESAPRRGAQRNLGRRACVRRAWVS